ncbi:MAG: DUF1827 family protein [Lactobacillus sp.]|nr:DUF1827 family protein [Lactobacillus sp.]
MHLIDITNNYSQLVQNQLNSTAANFVKVYSLGDTAVIYIETKDDVEISLENHNRKIREDEIEFIIKRLLTDFDGPYNIVMDKTREQVNISINK